MRRVATALLAAATLAAVDAPPEPAPAATPAPPATTPAPAPAADPLAAPAPPEPAEVPRAAAAERAAPRSWSFNATGQIGAKWLDSDDWGSLDRHGLLGLHFDFRRRDWPVNLAVGVVVSGDSTGDESDIEDYEWDDEDVEPDTDGKRGSAVNTLELQLGVRKYWEPVRNVFVQVGGGLAVITASAVVDDADTVRSDHDTGLGLWASAGLSWSLNGFLIGPQVTYSIAEVEISGADVDAGGTTLGLLLGFHY